MKYALLLITLVISSNGFAKDYGYKQEEYGYKSSSGSKYQYDRNSPVDSIKYKNDYNAQQRDEVNSRNPDRYKSIIEDAYGDKGRGAGILNN